MIALIAATRYEISGFINRLRIEKQYSLNGVLFFEAFLENVPVIATISGVGIKRARTAASVLFRRYEVSVIISAGFAGSLRGFLKVGDIVIASSAVSSEREEKFDMYCINIDPEQRYYKGLILSSNRFVNSSDKKRALSEKTDALCVDMETWSVAKVAAYKSIPVVGVRTISDTFDSNLPEMEKLFEPGSGISIKRSLRYFIANPRYIYPFFRFMYVDSGKAMRSLSAILIDLVENLSDSEDRISDQ